MTINPMAVTIRAKKLGVLIKDARLRSTRSIKECAQVIGVAPSQFEAYEMGEQSPSLPEIELYAYYLEIPLDHFWGRDTITGKEKVDRKLEAEKLVKIRQRMIGAQLRQFRMESGLSVEQLGEQALLSSEDIRNYELGEACIPLPKLESISLVLKHPVSDFIDRRGPVGTWIALQHAIDGFLEMPPELQTFVSKPINRPYIELAQRLSEMSVEKLRSVAEGLLEITL